MTNSWTVAQMPLQQGKRFLITGANSGIGYQAALELVRHGAEVLLACRDRARGEAALARLRSEAVGDAVGAAELILLDVASLRSVAEVADGLLARGVALHGLINNAGVFAPPARRETADGFELQWGTNVLGHFALTARLLPLLVRAGEAAGGSGTVHAGARVVTVASIAHKRGQIRWDDLQARASYNAHREYYQSKLGDLMVALELERRLRAARLPVISVAVHPGVAQSSLFKVGDGRGAAGVAERIIAHTVGLLLNNDAEGALPTLFGATAAEAEGGGYYGPQGFQEMRGGDVGPAQIRPQALDAESARRLWAVCEEATGCRLLS